MSLASEAPHLAARSPSPPAVYPTRHLPVPPSLPVEVVTSVRVGTGERRVECDVPCFWPMNAHGVVRRLHIHPIGVSLIMSMEGEAYYPELVLSNRDANHAIASTRFDSDIPMPYFSWAEYAIQSPAAPFGRDARPGASFVAGNCASRSGREAMVRELMLHMRVDSYGACLNNMFRTARREPKRDILRRYAVHLAFENQCVDDYITEKLWSTLEAGVIPAYYGAPNVMSHAPPHSIVHVRDFADMRSLARHIEEVSANATLRASYHAWRARPLPAWFVRKYNFTHVHSECRTCRWASALQRELRWDPVRQQALRRDAPTTIHRAPRTGEVTATATAAPTREPAGRWTCRGATNSRTCTRSQSQGQRS